MDPSVFLSTYLRPPDLRRGKHDYRYSIFITSARYKAFICENRGCQNCGGAALSFLRDGGGWRWKRMRAVGEEEKKLQDLDVMYVREGEWGLKDASTMRI